MQISKQDLLALPCLAESAYSILYRLDSNPYGKPALSKLPRFSDAGYFVAFCIENEYEITCDLELPGIRRAFEKVSIEGRPALVRIVKGFK